MKLKIIANRVKKRKLTPAEQMAMAAERVGIFICGNVNAPNALVAVLSDGTGKLTVLDTGVQFDSADTLPGTTFESFTAYSASERRTDPAPLLKYLNSHTEKLANV